MSSGKRAYLRRQCRRYSGLRGLVRRDIVVAPFYLRDY